MFLSGEKPKRTIIRIKLKMAVLSCHYQIVLLHLFFATQQETILFAKIDEIKVYPYG